MKSDLDRLMAERDLVALVVVGDETYSVPRDYLTNGAQVTGGLVVKCRDQAPVMIVNAMEVEEAAASGLKVYTYYDMNYAKILDAVNGDRDKATLGMWEETLRYLEVPPGRIGIYGTSAVNVYIEMVKLLNQSEDYEFVGEQGQTIFDAAYITKDADELARIRTVAAGTNATLQATWDFIASHRTEGGVVVNTDGQPLTIGTVKRFVRRTLLDYDLEDTGMIFAQGRDAGFPHSRGQADMPLRQGQTIIFDLFPREIGGGYHHDVTRTWCIDFAPEPVQKTYDTVMRAFEISLETYEESGQPAHLIQEAVLDYFEAEGHETQRSNPGSMQGYVHSLGHGVGLEIHERPGMSHHNKSDILQIGNVFSIEPGLYYPEEGYGVRIEDLVYINENGEIESLTDFSKDLVLRLQG